MLSFDRVHEDVLNALAKSSPRELTPDHVARLLEAEGIASFENLVNLLTDVVRDAAARSQTPTRITPELFSPPTYGEAATIVHRPPQIPLIIDGVEYEPTDIVRFDGRALDFIHSVGGAREALVAFTDRTLISTWLELLRLSRLVEGVHDVRPNISWLAPPRSDAPTGWPPPAAVTVFDHADFKGRSLTLPPGQAWRDLTQVRARDTSDATGRHPDYWNNRISSLAPTSSVCVYYEHVNFGGSRLIGSRYQSTKNLVLIGWNDCVSSFKNLG